MSDGIRIDFSITGCSFDFSYMLMYQAVARHIAQLLENHWTDNISPTLVSGTTFSHNHKAALFYQICFSFFDKTESCAYILPQWASMFNWQKLQCVYHCLIILLPFRAGIEVEEYAFDYAQITNEWYFGHRHFVWGFGKVLVRLVGRVGTWRTGAWVRPTTTRGWAGAAAGRANIFAPSLRWVFLGWRYYLNSHRLEQNMP